MFRKLTPASMRDDSDQRPASRLNHSATSTTTTAALRPPSRALTSTNTITSFDKYGTQQEPRMKVRLRKLDYNPFSPNEIEATEKFLPTLKGKLKKAIKAQTNPPAEKKP